MIILGCENKLGEGREKYYGKKVERGLPKELDGQNRNKWESMGVNPDVLPRLTC